MYVSVQPTHFVASCFVGGHSLLLSATNNDPFAVNPYVEAKDCDYCGFSYHMFHCFVKRENTSSAGSASSPQASQSARFTPLLLFPFSQIHFFSGNKNQPLDAPRARELFALPASTSHRNISNPVFLPPSVVGERVLTPTHVAGGENKESRA